MKRKSLALFTAACLLLAALAPAALAAPPAMPPVPEVTLTVNFNDTDDAGGGNSTTDNPMRTRVLNAVEALKLNNSSVTTGAITTIQLTGSAASITGYNWIFLYTALFDRGPSNLWTNLRTLDLSGMRDLRTVSGDNFSLSDTRDGTVLLPDSLQTIGDYAFLGCTALTALTLPDGVQSIGDYAFIGCTALTALTLPDGVQSIGDYAFRNCAALTALTLPDGVKTIGESAFRNCAALTSLTLPDGVQSIGDYAFRDCTALASLTLPARLRTIQPGTVQGCSSLASLTLPNALQTIGKIAFADCTSLASLTLPAGLQSIGEAAFSACTSLTSLTLPDGVKTIGRSAFYGCTSLASLTLPAGLSSIGDYAFSECRALASLTLPDGVPAIKAGTFQGCTALASLTLPAGLQSIEEDAFYNCTALETLRFRGQTAPTLNLNTVGGIWMFAGVSPALTLWVPESGTGYLGPKSDSNWRELVFQHDISIQTYFLAAPSAPSAYSLTVEQGAGGGWYRAGDSVTLKAIPPVEGAAFLRWELLSGYGDFADPASPETKFTMQIDNAAVRAVFELPAATTPPKTGDSDGATAFPLLTLAALAGFAALCLRRTRRVRTK